MNDRENPYDNICEKKTLPSIIMKMFYALLVVVVAVVVIVIDCVCVLTYDFVNPIRSMCTYFITLDYAR